jgi:hypothetical protein
VEVFAGEIFESFCGILCIVIQQNGSGIETLGLEYYVRTALDVEFRFLPVDTIFAGSVAEGMRSDAGIP